MPTVGQHYRHYKGTEYVVIALAKHSETEEGLVIYQDVGSSEKIWARPTSMFVETVEIDGVTQLRFTPIV
ncbi:MAG: hypothetical protein JWO43_254 [Candidatus Adlerbacteria bacterium]|nr:hypothetical protein [Candidatus Adlerbacteria bacterium]